MYTAPRPPRDIPHLLLPEKRRISHWNDRNEIRVSNWIEPWDFASPLDVGMINVPLEQDLHPAQRRLRRAQRAA